MEKSHVYRLIIYLSMLLIFAGCGGGGGAQGVATQPTTAVLKLYTLYKPGIPSPPASQQIAGVTVRIHLPNGVTLKTDAGGTVSTGVVAASGVTAGKANITLPVYTPATATAGATVSFNVVSSEANGFGIGEFATVNCEIAPGAFPAPGDFNLSDKNITGLPDYSTITTMDIEVSANIQ